MQTEMSARARTRAAREGDHAAAKTTSTYLVGAGATGALVAAAVIVFISLVGIASYDIWPGGKIGPGNLGAIELSPSEPGEAGGSAASSATLPPPDLVAARPTPSPSEGAPTGGGPGKPAPGVKPPAPAPAPGDGGGDRVQTGGEEVGESPADGGRFQPPEQSRDLAKEQRKAEHEAEKAARKAEHEAEKASRRAARDAVKASRQAEHGAAKTAKGAAKAK
jgi:hypothetical protein